MLRLMHTNSNYNPNSEYKIDINTPEAKRQIQRAQNIFEDFLLRFKFGLNFKDPETIRTIYQIARNFGIFKEAEKIRNLVFGEDIHFYGVCYLWDKCYNYCAYCPGSIPNRQKAIQQGQAYPLRELTVKQAIEDTRAIMKKGHRRICYLAGSAPGRYKTPDKIIPYLREIDKLGLEEIILNIEPVTRVGFKKIRQAVEHTSLQFRVFQETYDRQTYKQLHPQGPKADYDFRRQSQARALKAGFDNVGLGVLFGLHKYPLEEIAALRKHVQDLEKAFNKTPARVCLPSANQLRNIDVDVPYLLDRGKYKDRGKVMLKMGTYEKFNQLIYALARLAMPTINIVSSERDTPAMLEILNKYATCASLNVQPNVGGNANIFPYGNTYFKQALIFSRNPKETFKGMGARGYNPIIKIAD